MKNTFALLCKMGFISLFFTQISHSQEAFNEECLNLSQEQFSPEVSHKLCENALDEAPALCAIVLLHPKKVSSIASTGASNTDLSEISLSETPQFDSADIVEECKVRHGYITKGYVTKNATTSPSDGSNDIPNYSHLNTSRVQIRVLGGPVNLGDLSGSLSFKNRNSGTSFTGLEAGYAFYRSRLVEMSARGSLFDFLDAGKSPDRINVILSYVVCVDLIKLKGLKICASDGLNYFFNDVPWAEKVNDSNGSPPHGTSLILNYLDFTIGVNLGELFHSEKLRNISVEVMNYHRSGAAILFGNKTPFKSTQGNGLNIPTSEVPNLPIWDALNAYGVGVNINLFTKKKNIH